jgi:hypothetical protein
MVRVFWDLKLRHLVEHYQSFGAISCLSLQGRTVSWDRECDQTSEECRKGLKVAVEPVKTGDQGKGCFVSKAISITQRYSVEYTLYQIWNFRKWSWFALSPKFPEITYRVQNSRFPKKKELFRTSYLFLRCYCTSKEPVRWLCIMVMIWNSFLFATYASFGNTDQLRCQHNLNL